MKYKGTIDISSDLDVDEIMDIQILFEEFSDSLEEHGYKVDRTLHVIQGHKDL